MSFKKEKRVTGPSEKPWDNYGVPEADDKEQLIKIDKKPNQKQQQNIKDSVDKQMHDIIIQKRGWAYYEKH